MSSLLVVFLIFTSLFLQTNSTLGKEKPYIVYFGGHTHGINEISSTSNEKVTSAHLDVLASVLKSKAKARHAIMYSYTNIINGFAAKLTEEAAFQISKHPGVISVIPSKGYTLHTTHSWEFMGLERSNGRVPKKSLWAQARYGDDTIIGNIDSGVWPESESFKDDSIGPIPSRWKGACMDDADRGPFPCNRKLIGAKYFNKGYEAAVGKALNSTFKSTRDTDGHGTHTLSTAGGSFVSNVSLFGYGTGTSKGGSPKARVAAYKVCWAPSVKGRQCFEADIIAAFDAAIHDGVDVLSVSLGSEPADYIFDVIAIGSFHAISKGITVVCSAGNEGPASGTVTNIAPWIFTVGASTMDRDFPSYLSYDNKKHIKGQSLSTTAMGRDKFYPMVSSQDLSASHVSANDAKLCMPGSLDPEKTKGKLVICLQGKNDGVEKGLTVRQAGGRAMILANDITSADIIIADSHLLPATHISYSDSLKLYAYINSTRSAYGHLTTPKTDMYTKPAPVMAAFSSQGPNIIDPEILKPDITAPGVSVVASWTRTVAPSGLAADTRRASFNAISGTSMSCPHISGIVGLLKAVHPDWSPAALRSAIMTSARTIDNTGNPLTNYSTEKASPFSYGSGHVWPNRAMDPGLIYDISPMDYLNFLCALSYNSTQIKNFSITSYPCPSNLLNIENLNYPSISVPNLSGLIMVTRTVKNVGGPSTYKAHVVHPKGVTVKVDPDILVFYKVGEEKDFTVTLIAKDDPQRYVFGMLIWNDGKHSVRSPIVVKGKGY